MLRKTRFHFTIGMIPPTEGAPNAPIIPSMLANKVLNNRIPLIYDGVVKVESVVLKNHR